MSGPQLAHLPQHVVLLYTVDLAGADFSFQGVFKNFPLTFTNKVLKALSS